MGHSLEDGRVETKNTVASGAKTIVRTVRWLIGNILSRKRLDYYIIDKGN